MTFAIATTLSVWALRVSRELYGRPFVGIMGYLEVVLTFLVGAGLLYGLLHREPEVRVFTALLAGAGGLYQGLTMLPVLTHSIALTLLPSDAARVGVVVAVGLGASAVVGSVAEQVRVRVSVAEKSVAEPELRGAA